MNLCAKCASPMQWEARALIITGLTPGQGQSLQRAVEPYGVVLESSPAGYHSIPLFEGAFEIVHAWGRLLPDDILAEAQYLVLPAQQTLSFRDVAKMKPLKSLQQQVRNAWLPEMLRDNRFCVHFQPIYEMAPNVGEAKKIHAHECLMRGISTTGELVYPGKILDTAEEEDLVFHVDRLARINAIKAFAKQKVAGKVFINFNPISVYNPLACLATTVAAAKEAGITPDQIVIELIERDQAADEGQLMRIVDYYRGAGYGVALDDVGSGYSNLHLLSTLRPDYIKIDMTLIRNIDQDPGRQAVVSNLIDMGRRLGSASIVEGVETEAEYKYAQGAGANFVQGYLLGRPSPTAVGSQP